ncbi:MAG: hypothetical protein V1765_01670 [bacterium]
MTATAKQTELWPTKEYHFYEANNKRIMSYPEESRYGLMEAMPDFMKLMQRLHLSINDKDIAVGKVIEVTIGSVELIYDIVGIEEDENTVATNVYRVYVLPRQTINRRAKK